ncbi:DUF4251 domain-containing protein [uncultured Draconibacterium sp.]|uniref:DUF4251 domain-containing protein n=1 Tax=uncultured Draconibacterium sp. TaxID=1573823 RepID=UPI0032174A48
MKNLILITLLVFSVVFVNAQDQKKTKKEKKAEREAQAIEQTKKLIEAQSWQFDARQMIPAKGQSRSLTTSYNVVLKDNKVDSYLPYFGTAYSAPYGGTESPMIFKSDAENYSITDGKKGNKIVKFNAKNKNDNVIYTFTISTNGSTSLSVSSTNRQTISYYGTLVPVEEKEE